MRIALIHGINNQGRSKQEIGSEWASHLAKGNGPELVPRSVKVAFYGDLLAGAVRSASPMRLQSTSLPTLSYSDTAQFNNPALAFSLATEFRDSVVPVNQRSNTSVLVPKSLIGGFVNRLIGEVEQVKPSLGKLAREFIPQADAFFSSQGLRNRIFELVTDDLEVSQFDLVIAHSLGSVVAVELLGSGRIRSNALLTIGSPLGLQSIQDELSVDISKPTSVFSWHNGINPNDIVTLNRRLSIDWGEVDDNQTVRGFRNPHRVAHYLGNTRVRSFVRGALILA